MTFKDFKQAALRAVRSSVPLTCALFIADALLSKIPRGTKNSDAHLSGMEFEEDFNYSVNVSKIYSSIGPIRGKVAEVGPGGNAGVALHLLALGAQSVDLVDRFPFDHDQETLFGFYKRFENHDDLPKVRMFSGKHASAEHFFKLNREYDSIFSCAVLEHLTDPLAALIAMSEALNPGGKMVHQVDLRDHGMFSSAGKHELTFLSIPVPIYKVMTEARGRPNRVLIDDYRQVLKTCDLDFELKVTHLAKIGELSEPLSFEAIKPTLLDSAREYVDEIRAKMIEAFRVRAVDDLVVTGIRIEAVKPLR